MSEFLAIPIHPLEAERVKKVLVEWVRENDGAAYHGIADPAEKREIGNMIHDINAFTSKIGQKQYRMDWDLMEPIFYPNAVMRELAEHEKKSIDKALAFIVDGAWSIRHLEAMMGVIVSEIKERKG